MASSSSSTNKDDEEEELKHTLIWLEEQIDKRDYELLRLRRRVDEAEGVVETILRDNERLLEAFESGRADRRLFDTLLIDQSLLRGALEEYERLVGEANERAERAERIAGETTKNYENVVAIKDFYEQQVRILTKERAGGGSAAVGDLIFGGGGNGGNGNDGNGNDGASGSGIIENGESGSGSGIIEENVNGDGNGESVSGIIENGNGNGSVGIENGVINEILQTFFQDTTARIAISEAAIGQFCGKYGLSSFLSPAADNEDDNGISSTKPAAAVKTEQEEEENYDDDSIRRQIRSSKKKKNKHKKLSIKKDKEEEDKKNQRMIDYLRRKLSLKNSDLQVKTRQLDAYEGNIKKQNKTIAELLEKLEKMIKDRQELIAENKMLERKLKEFNDDGGDV